MRIPYDEIVTLLSAILRTCGFSVDRAVLAARLFTDASRDGVASHGLNRFPGFVRWVRAGHVQAEAVPTRVEQTGAVERWDGNLGPGMLNAHQSMARAMELAASRKADDVVVVCLSGRGDKDSAESARLKGE